MSCKDDVSPLETDPGYDFFPLEVGRFWLYEVQEVNIDGSVPDTANYFLREVLADSIVSGDGSITYLAERFVSQDTTTSYTLDSVWTMRRTVNQAIVTENNLPFVKLTFPVKIGPSWNGNALNSLSAVTYYYEEVSPFKITGLSVTPDNGIKMIIEDIPVNLVNQDERSEVYVKGIGLAKKDYVTVEFCQPNSGCNAVGLINKGRILSQHLIAYGKE